MQYGLNYSDQNFFERLSDYCSEGEPSSDVVDTVSRILTDVRRRGDRAVLAHTYTFDKVRLRADRLRVSSDVLAAAAVGLLPRERRAIREAIRCVRDFHKKTLPRSWKGRNPHGAIVGERFYPLERVGLYIPGGEAPLLSTVVMTAVLAKLAGVPQVAVCTPPQSGGELHPGMLAVLHLCGVEEVYRIGGIQAIGALAYGTQTVPAVAKIFGPGNRFVIEAKRQVFGRVGIDLLPGPSEVMILADTSANPSFIAADLLAQAEHGTGKEKVYLVATSAQLMKAVDKAIENQLPRLTREKEIKKVLEQGFLRICVRSLNQAAEVANFVAPEHLELHVVDKALKTLTDKISTAGSILIGKTTPTVLGDFVAGPSHTLPTGRSGHFFSGLQVRDFLRRTSLVAYQPKNLTKAQPTVEVFSRLEELDAHGRSLQIRL